MGEFEPVAEGVYQVGGSDLSDPSDAAVYAVVCEQGIVMIDCGAGKAPGAIVENMHEAGLDPDTVTTLILTHCHVDHIGSVEYFRRNFGCSVAAHDLDAGASSPATRRSPPRGGTTLHCRRPWWTGA